MRIVLGFILGKNTCYAWVIQSQTYESCEISSKRCFVLLEYVARRDSDAYANLIWLSWAGDVTQNDAERKKRQCLFIVLNSVIYFLPRSFNTCAGKIFMGQKFQGISFFVSYETVNWFCIFIVLLGRLSTRICTRYSDIRGTTEKWAILCLNINKKCTIECFGRKFPFRDNQFWQYIEHRPI